MDSAQLSGLIVAVILERPTCLVCIASKVGEPKLTIVRTITQIETTLRLTVRHDRCGACGSTLGPFYGVTEPAPTYSDVRP